MKRKILCLLCIGIVIISFTGCSNKKYGTKTDNKTSTEKVNYLDYDSISEFNDGIAIASNTINFETTKYVIDKDFNVLLSYKPNNAYEVFVGKYMKIKDKDDEKKINIIDQNGNIVYSYDDSEYKKQVDLVPNGLLIITEQTDTYNSSTTLTGIYDIESKKYVLEPNEKYVNKIREYGDNMLILDDDYKEFFNTKTKKVVTFDEAVMSKFVDGYSVSDFYNFEDLSTYLKVFDDNGNKKQIKLLFGNAVVEKQQNGMLLSTNTRFKYSDGMDRPDGADVQLFDLKKGTVKDISANFYSTDEAKFNKDGNALIFFENQGGVTYYTVIDKEGNMLFEPQKRNNEAMFGAESNEVPLIIHDDTLYDGGYFIGKENNLYEIIDKNNKVVVTSDNENETFKSVSNNSILVELDEPGKSKILYYKDLKGNKIELKINGKIKKYN